MASEYFGTNVPDAVAMAKWYVENLDMQIVCSDDLPPYTHLLADSTGRTGFKISSDPEEPLPNYFAFQKLRFQIASTTNGYSSLKDKLIRAGAVILGDEIAEDGSQVITFLDPWNIPFQLAKRIVRKEDENEKGSDHCRGLVLVRSETCVSYVRLDKMLAELDFVKYGPCPDELVELTLARLRK